MLKSEMPAIGARRTAYRGGAPLMQAAFQPQVAGERGSVRRGSQRAPPLQLMGESYASKSKKMKANERKIAFISFHLFFRIGTFQRVMNQKIKRSGFRLNSRLGLCVSPLGAFPSLHPPRRPRRSASLINRMIYSTDFWFGKGIAHKFSVNSNLFAAAVSPSSDAPAGRSRPQAPAGPQRRLRHRTAHA